MGFERLRLFAAMLDARDAFDFATARACLQELRDLTERMLACELEKGAPLLWPGASRSYLERFWSAAVEQGWERTVASGDLVAGAPETWHFLIDPAGVGERLGWWRDGAIGGNWQRLHTTAASWGDQGLHYYKGLAWYRTQLEVPADFAGRRVLAFFGGVDEQARVWLNGQLLGESAAGSFTPFELDATAAVRPGGTNTLAVCVTNRTLDELGTGGLTAPVMLWSPRAAVR
jgi:hypothetical protein